MSILKTHIELEQTIDYDYEPPEPESNHPESITINSVNLHGVELLSALSRSAIDDLEELCLDDVQMRRERE